jgi:hypothetical protein
VERCGAKSHWVSAEPADQGVRVGFRPYGGPDCVVTKRTFSERRRQPSNRTVLGEWALPVLDSGLVVFLELSIEWTVAAPTNCADCTAQTAGMASREELVEQHDALVAGMTKRAQEARELARLEGREFDEEKWLRGVSSKGKFAFAPPYEVSFRGLCLSGSAQCA